MSRSSRTPQNLGKGPRGPSGPWNRLKPVVQDPLESIGLPSRGDNRLLDPKTQGQYYTRIVERYMSFCSAAGERDELLRRFSSLEIETNDTQQQESSSKSPWGFDIATPVASSSSAPASRTASSSSKSSKLTGAGAVAATPSSLASMSISRPSTSSAASPTPNPSTTRPEHAQSLSSVLFALRKLREGIVASKRIDDFAVQAYLFCVRLGILVKQPETYHPAIQHLLRRLHPTHPLTAVELTEVVSYLVLDVACRRDDLAEAFHLRAKWKLRDSKTDKVLEALVHDDYVGFLRIMGRVDGYRKRVLEWAADEVRRHALKCVSKGYLTVDLAFLERVTGRDWEGLKRDDGVGWEMDGGKVVIRRVGKK